jgi:hypothetical protein
VLKKMLWVVVALALLLLFSVREGLASEKESELPKPTEKADEKPAAPTDPEPFPQNSLPCAEYETNFKRDKKDIDYMYCRGFNSVRCGDLDTKDPVRPCPVGYEKTSSRATLSA